MHLFYNSLRVFVIVREKEVWAYGIKKRKRQLFEAVPIGAGTYLDGKFFVWLRQKRLKSVRIPASFFLARQKIFLANLHTVTYWYSFLLPNRKVGRNICHVLRLPLFTAASKTACIKGIISEL